MRKDSEIPPPAAPPRASRRRYWPAGITACALVLLVLLIYGQVINHQFVAWDDTSYVSENEHVLRGVTWANLLWAFASFQLSNWHPLALLSHMLDVSLWGLNAGAHALSSVVLHALNVLLLFAFLRRLPGSALSVPVAGIVAGLWAAHPLHVESVAWISERKDVLCTFFWLLAMHAYLGWVIHRRARDYAMTTLAIAFALMSKPMAISLPLALLCLDIWPLGRLHGKLTSNGDALKHLLLEKMPWMLMAGATAWLTVLAQTGAMPVLDLEERVATGLSSYGWYIQTTFWPRHLQFYYRGDQTHELLPAVASFTLIVAISYWALRHRHDRPWLLAGWIWFIVTLLPIAGFVKVGTQAYADRYTYIPHIGLFLMIVVECQRHFSPDVHKRWLTPAFTAAIALLSGLSINQVAVWKDTQTLYEHALQEDPGHYVAMMGLAHLALRNGQYDVAQSYADQALARSQGPSLIRAMRIVRGEVALAHNEPQRAFDEFRMASMAEPGNGAARFRLGVAALRLGRASEAEQWFRQALALTEDGPEVISGLGASLGMQGRYAESLAVLGEGLRRWPTHVGLNLNFASAALESGAVALAEKAFRTVLMSEPSNAAAQRGLMDLSQQEAATPRAPRAF